MNKWTDELREYMAAHYPDEPTRRISEKFGVEPRSIRTLAKRMGIKKNHPVWTEDKVHRLVELFPDHTNMEIAEMIGSTKSAVMAKGCELGLRKSEEFMKRCWMKSAFRKGHVSFNKGMRQSEYMSPEAIERTKTTRFKKGNVPHNARPVGSERIDADGYVMIKPPKGVFRAKHVVIWEEAHGKVPKGYMVRFKDGNKLNVTLENLELVSMADNMRDNTIHKYPEDIQHTLRLIGTLNRRINKIEKNGKLRNSERKDAHGNRNAHEQQ